MRTAQHDVWRQAPRAALAVSAALAILLAAGAVRADDFSLPGRSDWARWEAEETTPQGWAAAPAEGERT